MAIRQATFAAGCFWGVQYAFDQVAGIVKTTVGYTGGHVESPSYEAVCRHGTGHAEAILIEFDEEQVTYEELLQVFWSIHNPTLLNRQGHDIGSQYRSAIFFHDPVQEELAKTSIQQLDASEEYDEPVVTQLVAATTFYPAEAYHQKYSEKNGIGGCSIK